MSSVAPSRDASATRLRLAGLRIVCPYCDPPWRCDTCDGAGFLYPDEIETHQPNEARYADC